MYFLFHKEMDVGTAVSAAKRCRSIIDPIGQLPEFLKRLKRAYESHPDAAGTKFVPIAPASSGEPATATESGK